MIMKYTQFKDEFKDLIEEYTYRAEQLIDIQKKFDKFLEKTKDLKEFKKRLYNNKQAINSYNYLIKCLDEIE